ncbi:hypothetical protein ACT7CY_13920 [Bacillus pacificus]
MNIEIFSVPGAATSPVVGIELQKQVELEGNLVAFIFAVDVA